MVGQPSEGTVFEALANHDTFGSVSFVWEIPDARNLGLVPFRNELSRDLKNGEISLIGLANSDAAANYHVAS